MDAHKSSELKSNKLKTNFLSNTQKHTFPLSDSEAMTQLLWKNTMLHLKRFNINIHFH